MLKTAAIVVLSVPLLLVGVCLSSSSLVVDVLLADGPRIIVPVPLVFDRAALAFEPDEATHIEIPELDDYADGAEQIVDELLDATDGVLVEVHDGAEHVLIAKVGDEIEIDVDGDEEQVSMRLPLTVVAHILESYDGERIETREVLEALSSISRTELVRVRTADEGRYMVVGVRYTVYRTRMNPMLIHYPPQEGEFRGNLAAGRSGSAQIEHHSPHRRAR